MPYAIGNIVYGLPITEKLEKAMVAKFGNADDAKDYLREQGFEILYTGDFTSIVGYCGVMLSDLDEINECMEATPLAMVTVIGKRLTKAQKKEVKDMIAKLDREIVDIITEDAFWPAVYLIWSSS